MSTTTDEGGRYVLRTGQSDRDRLALLNRFYNPGSTRFLRAAGLTGVRRVLEVGCGQGQMAHWLAEELGPCAEVVGVDLSEAQLEVAERECPHPARCTWVRTAADRLDVTEGPFDLVYSRFLLQHVPAPERVLAAMRDVLAPGGLLVVEDALVEGLRIVPRPDLVPGAEDWWFQLGERVGTAVRSPEQLPIQVRALGLTLERFESHQPVSFERDALLLHVLGSEQLYPAVVAHGIATQEEVDAQRAILMHAMDDDHAYIELYRALQVAARKPH